MGMSGLPGEEVDTHLKIYGHLPEMECYEIGEPPIVCRNPKYDGVQRISESQEAATLPKTRLEITAPYSPRKKLLDQRKKQRQNRRKARR